MDFLNLTQKAVDAALQAGELIRSYQDRKVEVLHKEGADSLAAQVVTQVDQDAQEKIEGILLPTCEEFNIAWLGEEGEDDHERFEKDFFWCVDPMDGTLPFIEGKPGYSVSIGLVAKNGTAYIGVVYDPVHDVLYQATKGAGLRRNGESWHPESTADRLTFTYDRSFVDHPALESILADLETYAHSKGLQGLKASQHGGAVINACYVLEEAPGCYFKFPKKAEGGGSLWDFAATACLFEEADAIVSDIHGNSLDLNRKDSTYMNHLGFLYSTDMDLAHKVQEIFNDFGSIA